MFTYGKVLNIETKEDYPNDPDFEVNEIKYDVRITRGVPHDIWKKARDIAGGNPNLSGYFGIGCGLYSAGMYMCNEGTDEQPMYLYYCRNGEKTYFPLSVSKEEWDREVLRLHSFINNYALEIRTNINTTSNGTHIMVISAYNSAKELVARERYTDVDTSRISEYTSKFVDTIPKKEMEGTHNGTLIFLGQRTEEQFSELLNMSVEIPDIRFIDKNTILAMCDSEKEVVKYLKAHDIAYSIDKETKNTYTERIVSSGIYENYEEAEEERI